MTTTHIPQHRKVRPVRRWRPCAIVSAGALAASAVAIGLSALALTHPVAAPPVQVHASAPAVPAHAPPPRAARPALPQRPAVTQHYVVRSGDCLWTIALREYGNGALWPRLYHTNRAIIGTNPALIQAGQNLTIPRL